MPNVTSLEVSFSRTTQPRPYESVAASVRLTVAFRDEEAQRTVDEEIDDAMQRAIAHVEKTLGIAPAKKEVAVVETKGMGDAAPAKKVEAAKPAPKEQKASPIPAPAPAEETFPAEEGSAFTHADANAAITQAIARMQQKGVAQPAAEVKRLVASYFPEGSPPAQVTYRRIPEDSLGDFISDVSRLGR